MLTREKRLDEVAGISIAGGIAFQGYEMHIGKTAGPDRARPLLRFADGRTDGAISANGNIRAAYVHGLFGHDGQRTAWLQWLGGAASGLDYDAEVDRVLDALAAHLERCIDLEALLALAR